MSQFSNPLDLGNPLEQNKLNPLAEQQPDTVEAMPPVDNVEVTNSKEREESQPLWSTTDVLAAPVRGAVDFAKGIYNAADWVSQDLLPDWDTNPMGESTSTAGGLLSGLVEFGIGFLPGLGLVKGLGALGKAGKLGKVGTSVGWMAKITAEEKAASPFLSLGRRMGQDAVAGVAVDFILATPGQQRLSNLATQFDSPLLNNDITKYLASGEGETELEARFKSALESLPLGLALDAGMHVIGKIAKGMMGGVKAARGGQVEGNKVLAAGGTEEAATKVATEEELRIGLMHAEDIQSGKKALDDLVEANSKGVQETAQSRTAPDSSQVNADNRIIDNSHEYIQPKKGSVSFANAPKVQQVAVDTLDAGGFIVRDTKGGVQVQDVATVQARFSETKTVVENAIAEVQNNPSLVRINSGSGITQAVEEAVSHVYANDYRGKQDQLLDMQLVKDLLYGVSDKQIQAKGFTDAFDKASARVTQLVEISKGTSTLDNPKAFAAVSHHMGESASAHFTESGGRMRTQGFLNGGSVHETMQDAVSNSEKLGLTKTQVALAKWLLKAVPNQLKESPLHIRENVNARTAGQYNYNTHSIEMFGAPRTVTAGSQFHTILHETVHALTIRKIDEAFAKVGGVSWKIHQAARVDGITGGKNGAGVTGNDKLFTLIPQVAKKNPEVANLMLLYKSFVENVSTQSKGSYEQGYGSTNLHEFLAEGMSNPTFQQVMRQIQTPDKSNLWTKFVEVIGGLMQGKASREFRDFERSLNSDLKNASDLPHLSMADGSFEVAKAALKPGAKQATDTSVLDSFLQEGSRLIEQPSSGMRDTNYQKLATNYNSVSQMASLMRPEGSGIDPSFAPRNDAPKQPAPIPNIEQPAWNGIGQKVADLLQEARVKGGLSEEGLNTLISHIQEATGENLENMQHGFDKGTRSPEFLLVVAEAIKNNKDAVGGVVTKMTNKETAARAALIMDAIHAVGGMNSEQEAIIAATFKDYIAPQFEQLAAVVSAMVGNKAQLMLDVMGHGDKSAQDQVLSCFMVLNNARKAGNSIAGRVLQNAKMLWQESLAYKIKAMSPQEITQNLERFKQLAEIAEIDKQTFFKIMNNGFVNAGGTGQMTWLFKNSILSGPSTSAVNILSGVLSMIYMPAERAFGHAALSLVGQSTMSAAARELRVYRGYLTAFSQVWNDASTAPCWKNIKASWEQEGNSVAMGSGSSPMGEFVPRRPIASDNPAISKVADKVGMPTQRWDPATKSYQTTVFGTALDWFGKLAGTPTRLMGTIDETLSIVSAQAEGREIIIDSADAAIKANPALLAKYVDTKMKEVFDDVGALFSEDAVRARIMREAKAAGHTPGDGGWRMYVQNQMARQWHAPQGLDRENNILLQKIAAKVRSRVEESTFKRDYDTIIEGNTIGPAAIGNLGKAASGLVQQVPALGMIIPFVKTPTNLAAWALERSPSSAGRMLYKQWQNPELRGEVMGRLCAGTLMYGTMMTLAMSGKLTGRGPNDPNVRKALVDSGWQPNSFKIGETWVQYARMDPLATIFGMAADMVEIASHKYTDQDFLNATDAIAKVSIGTIANNLVNKTYLAGLKGTLDAITSWETKGDAFVKQYAGSFVPNIIAQSNLVMNDDLAAPQGALDAIRSRIPGLSHTVDRRRNALGEPMENNTEAWNLAMPTVTTKTSNDPVRRELANLLVGFAPPAPQLDGGINLTQHKNGSGQSAYDRYQQLTSQVEVGGRNLHDRLAQLIGSDTYQRMPDKAVDGVETSRVGMLRSEISRYRRHALTQLGQEFPDIQQRKNDVMDIRNQMKRGN